MTATTPPGTWERVVALPWVLQVLAVVFVAVIIAQAIPKAAGPWQAAVESWVDSRRRVKAAVRGADVDALRGQVDEVQSVLSETRDELGRTRRDLALFRAETRRYQHLHDTTLTHHAAWDRIAVQAVIDRGGLLPPTPGLWPDLARPDFPGDGDHQEAIGHA